MFNKPNRNENIICKILVEVFYLRLLRKDRISKYVNNEIVSTL